MKAMEVLLEQEISKKGERMPMKALESPFEICSECGGKKSMVIEMLGVARRVPILCFCKNKAYEEEKKREQRRQEQLRLERLKSYSLMDKTAEKCTFDNWQLEEDNKKLLRLGRRYCVGWERMQKENIGLLLWGPPGTGKTFLGLCIANELLCNLTPVIAISSIGLLNRIKATYNSYGREGETEIIKLLQNASLLVLDDLGAENSTEWSSEKLYEIIDSRYRTGKPMVVTTNLSLEALKEKLAGRDGISRSYDRLMEMCIPIEVKGRSRRASSGRSKTQTLKALLE